MLLHDIPGGNPTVSSTNIIIKKNVVGFPLNLVGRPVIRLNSRYLLPKITMCPNPSLLYYKPCAKILFTIYHIIIIHDIGITHSIIIN